MIRRFLAVFTLFIALTTSAFAADALTAAQKAEVESIVKAFITAHPEVMISSVESYYTKKQAESNSAQNGKIDDKAPASLMNDPNSPTLGNKNAKVAVVEFFDYNCGYCKQVSADVEKLMDNYKDRVKFIFKELPILAESSKVAARYALAADKQGKYWEFHERVMTHQGPIDERYLEATAKDAGLDTDKLKKDLNDPSIEAELEKTIALARGLGVRGTPYFIIGKEKVPGAVTYDQMKVTLDMALDGKSAATTTTSPTAAAAQPETVKSIEQEAPVVPVTSAASDPLKGTGPEDDVADNPEVKAEIARARAETSAMVEEIKKQAEEIKKQAAEATAKANAAAEKQAKATAAAQAAAEKKQ